MDFSTTTSYLKTLFGYPPEILVGGVYEKYLQYWPIFLIGFLISLILTPIIGKIALKNNITYIPNIGRRGKKAENPADNPQKALHEGITPSLGGLAIAIPILLAIPFFFKLDSFTIPIFVSLLILIIGATLDDIFNLPAKIQFTYQILAAGIIAFSILNITTIPFLNIDMDMFRFDFSILGLQQSLSLPGDIFLFIWLIVCINAVKWTAGSPGIIEANSLVIFSLIFIIAIRDNSVFSSTISILAAGGLSLFLLFAFPPQKIMTGSAGKSVYGFLICVLSIIADTKISTTIMLLMLPLVDFAYVLLKRLIQYKPKNISELMQLNGPDHLHHQLLKLELTRTQLVLVETATTLFLGAFAILTTGAIRYFTLTICAALGIGFVFYINFKASRDQKEKDGKESPESKYSY